VACCSSRTAIQQRHEVDVLGLFQRAAALQVRQFQQAVDHRLGALRLLLDVAGELFAGGLRHRFAQQFGGAADRRQRAFQFMRERLHVLVDIAAAGERVARFGKRGAQRVRQPARQHQRRAALAPHRQPDVAQQAERTHQPQRGQQQQQCEGADRDQADQQQLLARVGDERQERGHRLAHRDHADDVFAGEDARAQAERARGVALADRRAHVHHRRGGIGFVEQRGARAVGAGQRQLHVAPGEEVLTHVASARVEQHDAVAVGHVHVQVDRGLLDVEDARVDRPTREMGEGALQVVGRDHAVEGVALEQRGEQVGGVDQRLFRALAVARIQIGGDALEQEGDRRQVDDEDADEDAGAAGHIRSGCTRCFALIGRQ
jgi:hypothetical protein